MRKLAADPSLVKQTVEEVLRWITPVPGFMRNAQQDIELRGQKIKQGQYVYLLYFAANRDEECWTDPDTFDITRPPSRPCCRSASASTPASARRWPGWRRAFSWRRCWPVSPACPWPAKPQRVGSPLQHGWHELPVVFER